MEYAANAFDQKHRIKGLFCFSLGASYKEIDTKTKKYQNILGQLQYCFQACSQGVQ